MWLAAVTCAVGCARNNPVFDGVETEGDEGATGTKGDASAGGSMGADGTGGSDPTDPTAATDGPDPTDPTDATDPTTTGIDGTDTGVDVDTGDGSTGSDVQNQVTLFVGADMFGGSAKGTPVPSYGAGLCEATKADQIGNTDCPSGHVWALLPTSETSLAEFPTLPGGEFLTDTQIYTADGTVIAASYADLVDGNLLVPPVGTLVEGKGDFGFWWGVGDAGVVNCQDWTNGTDSGEAYLGFVDNVTPTIFTGLAACNQSRPVLCVCF